VDFLSCATLTWYDESGFSVKLELIGELHETLKKVLDELEKLDFKEIEDCKITYFSVFY